MIWLPAPLSHITYFIANFLPLALKEEKLISKQEGCFLGLG